MQNQSNLALPKGLKDTSENGELGYPVQVYYIELTNLHMRRIRWHWHAEMEAVIINHGEAFFLADDTKLHLTAGRGVLVNQNIMHSVQPVNPNVSCSLYSLKFHPAFLFGSENTMLADKYLTPVLNSPDLKIIELHEEDGWHEKLVDVINSIIAVNLTRKYGYELLTQSHLCQLWNLLLKQTVPQNTGKNKRTTASLDEERVKEAILYVEKHYHEHITLQQLAAAIHISKSECCRCFKRTLHLSPFEYLMRYRIFRAANMLQQNSPEAHSISSLALSVGFNNASYFNKIFKQYLDCTPSEYKRRIKDSSIDEGSSFQPFTQ